MAAATRCKGSDLIVFSAIALWGRHIAEALAVPGLLATLVPIARTRAFRFLKFTQRTDQLIPGIGNLLSYRLVDLLIWQRYAKPINRYRQKILNLPKLGFPLAPQYRHRSGSTMPIINCYSETVVAPPSDWKDTIHQAGYCFLDLATTYSPPPALQAFLNEEPQPVYVGFGSMISRRPEQLAQTIVSAIEATGQRAVLCSGWGEVGKIELPSSIYLLEDVPHDWLFPRVAAAIHHGAAGTTAATLNAGIPSVVVPFFADQPTWGERLEQLGISPATHPVSELTSEQLAGSIRSVVQNDSFRERAQALRAQIQEENGVDRAVSIMESYLPS